MAPDPSARHAFFPAITNLQTTGAAPMKDPGHATLPCSGPRPALQRNNIPRRQDEVDDPDRLESPAFDGDHFALGTPTWPPSYNRSKTCSSFHLSIPFITPGQLAFSAMQFLPVPVLVLDSLKTVVLANEAMGHLLGMMPKDTDVRDGVTTVMERLRGQSLSQVGIDVIQDDRLIWVDWEQFLDQIIQETGISRNGHVPDHSDDDGDAKTPTVNLGVGGGISATSGKQPNPITAVEVVISRNDLDKTTFDSRVQFKADDYHTLANMIITLFEVEHGQTYITLTFTNSASSPTSCASPTGKKAVARPSVMEASERKTTSHTSNPASVASSHDSSSSSFWLSPNIVSLSSSPFPPLGPPSRTSHQSAPSILQKITLMKDALLNNTQTPIQAMWKDGSVTFPNQAARKLFKKHDSHDRQADGYDILPSWTCWTEDFSKQLETSEYPMAVLLRTETPFSGMRVGMMNESGEKNVFDMLGEAIRDDMTGEFLAGVVTCRDVTKMAAQIDQMRAADEERFKVICETMPQLVWTATPDGMCDFFNGRWCSYTGLTVEESVGNNWTSILHKDDMAATCHNWEHALKTGGPYNAECRFRSKNGSWRWFLARALPLRNGQTGAIEKWFGTCTDVNEGIEAQLEAKRTRQQLLTVIAHSHMTIFNVDLNRKVTMLEGALIWDSTCDGAGSRWYIGEDVYEVFKRMNPCFRDGRKPPFLRHMEDILEGKKQVDYHEHEIEGRWYRTRHQPVLGKKAGDGANDGVLEGVIGLVMDVTELKAKERDLEDQAREKRQLLANEAAAKEASRLKSQFLANMSHEIRTPITGVIGMAELLMDLELDDEQRDYTENIYRSANALLTVINDILDFSKVESGRLDIEEVRFSLSVIVKDVSKMLSFAAERKNLDFRSDIASDIETDMVVIGDPGRVRQIITNLLTNSIKFTNQGYVKFSVSKAMETAETMEIKFVVEDSGIGIDEDVRKRLFQPFSQGDASTARKFGGTGLGLTICKHLLELMSGRITLDSSVGSGTTATFHIPFSKPQDQHTDRLVRIEALPDRLQSEMSVSCNSSEFEHMLGTPPPDASSHLLNPLDKGRSPHRRHESTGLSSAPDDDLPAAERAKILVLVVEDNAINSQIATKTIQKLGFQVTAAWNGKEALEYLTAAQQGEKRMPDIILMDVQMPVIDGYKCTHLLRHHLPYKTTVENVPIVAMTASAIQGDREKCRKAGMDDYLAKPVKSRTLERMLVRWGNSQRPRLSTPPRPSPSVSECSQTSEQCENAEIPNVALDYDSTPMVHEDGETEGRASFATPRPFSQGENNGHFPGYTVEEPPCPESSNSRDGPPEEQLALDPNVIQPVHRTGTDELAAHCRDDKLIAAGGVSIHLGTSPLPTGEALTEANVGRLGYGHA